MRCTVSYFRPLIKQRSCCPLYTLLLSYTDALCFRVTDPVLHAPRCLALMVLPLCLPMSLQHGQLQPLLPHEVQLHAAAPCTASNTHSVSTWSAPGKNRKASACASRQRPLASSAAQSRRSAGKPQLR